MITALILEDEPKSMKMLEKLLQSNFSEDLRIVASCSNIIDAEAAILNLKPELLFLDIEVAGKTSFELLEKTVGNPYEVIFTTAFDHYALKAIKFSALDYLLKPIDEEELRTAVNKIKEKKKNLPDMDSIKLLIQQMKVKEPSFSRISLPSVYGQEIVNINDIIRCDSEEHYTRFTLVNKKKLLVSNTLKYYEDLLPEDKFFRIHNSHLVNIEHVVRVTKEGYVLLSDDSTAEISRRKKESFVQKIGKL
jgi:two-component system, LytTR family, response regulator